MSTTLQARVSILNAEADMTADDFLEFVSDETADIQAGITGDSTVVELHVLLPDALISSLGKATIEDAITKARTKCPAIISVRLALVKEPIDYDLLMAYAEFAKSGLTDRIDYRGYVFHSAPPPSSGGTTTLH